MTVAATVVTATAVTTRTWKVLLQQDHANVTVNVDAAVTGTWEMKESELLMLNHGKDKG